MKTRKLLILVVIGIFALFLTKSYFIRSLPFKLLRTNLNRDVIKQAFKNAYDRAEATAIQVNYFDATKNNFSYHTVCASELFVAEEINAGFAAIVLSTIDHINLCLKLGAKPTVFWRKCGTVCPKDPHVNAWELYFKPINPNIVENARRVVCLGTYMGPDWLWEIELFAKGKTQRSEAYLKRPKENVINLSFRQRTNHRYYGEGLITQQIKLKTNQLIKNFIHVQPKIQAIVDEFFNKKLANKVVLAVHIRGTDHYLETDNLQLTPLAAYIQNTKQIMAKNPEINKIFVASDNRESITAFVKEFGQLVVFTRAIRARRYNGHPVHASGMDPYKLGSQVLIDILLMSKCKYFLHGESSVAALVTYFNPDIEDHFVEISQSTRDKTIEDPGPVLQDSIESDKEENNEEFENAYSTFLENSRYSVCPNFQKGIFTSVKELVSMQTKENSELK